MERLIELAGPDMAGVDALIGARLQSPCRVIPALADHLIAAGGKRLRPLLTVAAARLAGATRRRRLKLATAVEFIHTATLLHDDVVDGSKLRRGKVAAHLIWGGAVQRPGRRLPVRPRLRADGRDRARIARAGHPGRGLAA